MRRRAQCVWRRVAAREGASGYFQRRATSGGTKREPSMHMSGKQASNPVGTRTVAVTALMA